MFFNIRSREEEGKNSGGKPETCLPNPKHATRRSPGEMDPSGHPTINFDIEAFCEEFEIEDF